MAITAGLAAESIALLGFGIDSGIEVFAASVVAWQLRAGAHARTRSALRLIALSFVVLGGWWPSRPSGTSRQPTRRASRSSAWSSTPSP